MTIALYAGSFDPLTNGHLDIIQAGSKMYEKLIVGVAYNCNKSAFIPVETRLDLIKKSVNKYSNVEVRTYEGLTVEFAKNKNATVLIRGLRNSSDFEYEKELARVNYQLESNIRTVFLMSSPEFDYVSSSMIRELVTNKADISKFVPKCVNDYLRTNVFKCDI